MNGDEKAELDKLQKELVQVSYEIWEVKHELDARAATSKLMKGKLKLLVDKQSEIAKSANRLYKVHVVAYETSHSQEAVEVKTDGK